MNAPRQKFTKAMALLLVFVVLPTYTQANLLSHTTPVIAPEAGGTLSTGKLITQLNLPIDVNGNSASSGLTILTGARIRTPEAVGAAVQLDKVTRVELAPGTDLTLAFGKGRVAVRLLSGSVVMTADKGVAGSVTTPEGKTLLTDVTTISTVTAQGNNRGNSGNQGGQGQQEDQAGASAEKRRGGLFNLGWPATIAILGGAAAITTAAIVVPCRRGRNPSPGTPRRRNDECR